MSVDFHTTIALYRTTRGGVYQFLRRLTDGSYEHIEEAIQCPDIEGVCTISAYDTNGREGRLVARPWSWERKTMEFIVLRELLKVRNQDVLIPIIKPQNSTYRFALRHHILRKSDIPRIAVTGTYNVRNAPRSRHAPAPAPVVFTGPPVATHVLPPPRQPAPASAPRITIERHGENEVEFNHTTNTVRIRQVAPTLQNALGAVEQALRYVPASTTRSPPPVPVQPPTIPQYVANLVAREAETKKEKCSITLEDITFENASVTSCFHVFNREAITQHRATGNRQCPVCRQTCSVIETTT